jgi:hypothetical protein
MIRALAIAALAVLTGCLVEQLPNAPKDCPCSDGYTCKIEDHQCERVTTSPTADLGCVVSFDGALWCGNQGGVPIYELPTKTSARVTTLINDYNSFECWSVGDYYDYQGQLFHTWVYTHGTPTSETSPAAGWLPGNELSPPSKFIGNPNNYGFGECPALRSD